MPLDDLRDEIISLPVWDTHNHLEGSRTLCAQTFWDFGHYFWFLRELEGVGYPWLVDAMELSEKERAEAYAKAFAMGRNTYWSQAVRRTLKDLWDLEITDADSILRAGSAIAATGQQKGWADQVCERANIRTLTVGRVTDNGIAEIADRLYLMGKVSLPREAETAEIAASADPAAASKAKAASLTADIARQVADGRRVFRCEAPRGTVVPPVPQAGASVEDIGEYFRHVVFRAFDENRAHVQVFVGCARADESYTPRTKAGRAHALNDTTRIPAVHDVFDMYAGCTFEIVNSAQLSNLDIVQAARAYPNVAPGGLWWFNFRASTYRECMQYRMEALPATRCTFLATDARCIEWAYCKTMLVKRLMAEFLCDQVQRGWADEEIALYVARQWLHDSAATLYAGER